MPDAIEVYTARYEREHGHKPQGKRFWRFILVSQSVTDKDYSLVLDQPMIYPMALEKAQEVRRAAQVHSDHRGAVAARGHCPLFEQSICRQAKKPTSTHLRLVAPNTKNRTVAPKRRPNAEVRR
jgi:hypothetical protein